MTPEERAMHIGDGIDLREEHIQGEIDRDYLLAVEFIQLHGLRDEFGKFMEQKQSKADAD